MDLMTSLNDVSVTGRTNQGAELRGNILRLSRYDAVIEIYSNLLALQSSAVVHDFKIITRHQPIYSGRGVIKQVINTGLTSTCEVTLEDSWLDLDAPGAASASSIQTQFRRYFQDRQKTNRILQEFKVVIADVQCYLLDLRAWLQQLELTQRSSDSPSMVMVPSDENVLRILESDCRASLDMLFDRFENIIENLEPALRPVHRHYACQHLHPLIMCAPFVYRTYFKPLGYAGDYEMVNMIERDRFEGNGPYAKLVNYWFLQQPPAVAHRNRIQFLRQRLIDESVRVSPRRSGLRVLNLGCGPAAEIQQFLLQSDLSDQAQFTLYDFNDETIAYAQTKLYEAKQKGHRRTQLSIKKKSVQQILKESAKSMGLVPDQEYDFVYCAGLFDYLSDTVCQRIISVLLHWTAPGGLLLLTNVDLSNPRRHTMESLLEWNLIYRDTAQARKILPAGLAEDACKIHTELSGVNIVLEIRKP